jgi:hypothetical protein
VDADFEAAADALADGDLGILQNLSIADPSWSASDRRTPITRRCYTAPRCSRRMVCIWGAGRGVPHWLGHRAHWRSGRMAICMWPIHPTPGAGVHTRWYTCRPHRMRAEHLHGAPCTPAGAAFGPDEAATGQVSMAVDRCRWYFARCWYFARYRPLDEVNLIRWRAIKTLGAPDLTALAVHPGRGRWP